MSNDTTQFFTTDTTGIIRPATADEILDAARVILYRVHRSPARQYAPANVVSMTQFSGVSSATDAVPADLRPRPECSFPVKATTYARGIAPPMLSP